jgi:hypothetical protein
MLENFELINEISLIRYLAEEPLYLYDHTNSLFRPVTVTSILRCGHMFSAKVKYMFINLVKPL